MLFEVIVAQDAGDVWIANYITMSDRVYSMDPSEKYLHASSAAIEIVKEERAKGSLIKIPKNIEGEVLDTDLIIEQQDPVEQARAMACYDITHLINGLLETTSIIDVYAFTAIFSKFAARGIFITDENIEKVKELYKLNPDMIKDKDKIYVDILMSNSEEDLHDLEVYTESLDKMKRIYERKSDIDRVIKRINSAETVEEIEEIKNNYLHRFTFPAS